LLSRGHVVRRCHKKTLELAERAQPHAAVGKRTQAQRDIDAVPHKVDPLVGEAEVDRDPRSRSWNARSSRVACSTPKAAVQETRIVPAGAPRSRRAASVAFNLSL
jgi:hypothetical protein